MHISPAEAIWGFKKEWPHFDGTMLSLSRSSTAPDGTTIKMKNKGLKDKSKNRGDVYLRLKMTLPKADDKDPEQTITLSPKADRTEIAKITRESDVEIKDGMVFKRWEEAETVRYKKSSKKKKEKTEEKQEL